jgi:hypothetical protein
MADARPRTGTARDLQTRFPYRPAERHAAAELRAGHAEHVTPTQSSGRVAIDIDAVIHATDFDSERYGCLVDVNSLKDDSG